MIPEELKQKHESEWQEFFMQREQRQAELWRFENDIIEALDMEQSRIPHSLRQRLDKDWKDFEEEWGNQGTAFKALSEKQMMEFSEQDKSDIAEDSFQYEHLSGKEKEWAELQHDHRAIEEYYQAKGCDIPKATQNRMKMHIENYKRHYNIPYEPDESLVPKTKKDFAMYGNVHEIYEADFAIAQSYEDVPDSTNDRLRQDLTEYFSMSEVLHAIQHENSLSSKVYDKFLAVKSRFTQGKTKNERRDEFKQRMQPKQGQSRNKEQGMDMD